ncbi:MAG: tetratricopeptide repeat protein [candidate division Zixibacteria bacterium]|nr:tetratricopeptide repeat protein [candidate division Zixibacteria bacterium]
MIARHFLLMIAACAMTLEVASQPDAGQPASDESPSLQESPLETGKSLYQQGRFDEALALLRQAVRDEGRSAPARYWLGMAWLALGNDDEALKAFRRATQLDKDWAPGHVGMAMVYMRLPNRRLDARKALRNAIEADPGDADIHYYLGMTYMDQVRTSRLIGSEKDGRRYFQKTVELNPSHPDAYFQLGRCYDSPPEPEHEKAIAAYMYQYRVNPDHDESLLRFADVNHRSERYDLGVRQLRGLVWQLGEDAPARIRTMLAQFEVLSLVSEEQYGQLQEALEDYVALLDADERAVYRDLRQVAPQEELQAWKSATGPERESLWRAFWNERDANPATTENERLVEHYRRVMYARVHFSGGQQPYDRRGEIYIRYGAPDDRRRFVFRHYEDPDIPHMLTGNPAVDAIREKNLLTGYRLQLHDSEVPFPLMESVPVVTAVEAAWLNARSEMETQPGYVVESWVYVRHDLELFFVDMLKDGNFDYPLKTVSNFTSDMVRQDRFHPRQRAAELIDRRPEVYAHDFGGERLEYAFDAVSFRGESGSTEVDLTYSIPVWQFGDITDEKGDRTWLNNLVTVRDSVQTPVLSRAYRFGPIERPERQAGNRELQGAAFTLAANLTAPSGMFTAAVEMRDEATRRIGVYKKSVSFSDYSGGGLLISDLKLSTAITPAASPGPFVRRGLNVVPNPGRLYPRGHLVYVYYEVYNLKMDEGGRTSYETLYEITPKGMPALRNRRATRPGDMQTVMSFFEGAGQEEEEAEFTALDTTDLEAGEYVLTVTLTDRYGDDSVSKSVNFMVVEP